MPVENLEEEGLPKNPNLEWARLKFLLTLSGDDVAHVDVGEVRSQLLQGIRDNDMAPFYEEVCAELKWDVDNDLLTAMKANNEQKLKELEEAIEDAEQNLGETDVRDAAVAKAEYLCKIGHKDQALKGFRLAYEKTATLGSRLDLVFYMIRIGMFYGDGDLTVRNIEKAKSLIEEGGDWDRRNRLKVYEGVYCMSVRDFDKAATLFLEAVATFTSYELMDYKQFVRYTVLVSMLVLERPKLRESVVKGAEIQEILHGDLLIRNYLDSMYKCHYADFFKHLAEVEAVLVTDRWLAEHRMYIMREMRVNAYNQLLQSYHALTLSYMANAFGVTVGFIDRELSRFIAAGRLNCKIDKVAEVVETNRPDKKNYQYQAVIKQGDLLLNRVQKLSRIISI